MAVSNSATDLSHKPFALTTSCLAPDLDRRPGSSDRIPVASPASRGDIGIHRQHLRQSEPRCREITAQGLLVAPGLHLAGVRIGLPSTS